MRLAILFTLSIVVANISSTSIAQDKPSASEMAAARALFNKGVEAAEAERWSDALGFFKKSYAVAEVPVTLFNIANAQEETGQLVAASETYHTFLGLPPSRRTRKYRSSAKESLEKIEKRVAHVDLAIEGLEGGDTLEIDEAEISRAAIGVDVPLDPGSHNLTVERAGDVVLSHDFELDEGESSKLELKIEPKKKVVSAPVAPEEPSYISYDEPKEKKSKSVFKKPLFWIIVGAVVAGGVVAAVLLTRDRSPNLFSGNLGPGMTTFK